MTIDIPYKELKPLINSPRLPEFASIINELLTVEESERIAFYNRITEKDKAEFINGEVIFHSPVKLWHSNASKLLSRLMSIYADINDLGLVGYEKLMISLSRNDYEPDIVFFRKEKAEQFKPTQMRFPAPDLIVEILSKSTEANDRGVKFEDYAAHGVEEYWIIDPELKIVEQYLLGESKAYELKLKASDGTLKSQAISGFSIPVQAIFDRKENNAVLQKLYQQ